MTHFATISASERRSVRELLIEQQRGRHHELPLPRLLRTPAITILWMATIAVLVTALALGRVRVPRVERGVVVTEPSGDGGLTPVLVLPSSARRYVAAGQLASVDTGGQTPVTVAFAAAPPPARDDRGGTWLSFDTTTLALPLERCHRDHCLPLARGRRFTATVTLGTRSLASFALPRS